MIMLAMFNPRRVNQEKSQAAFCGAGHDEYKVLQRWLEPHVSCQ